MIEAISVAHSKISSKNANLRESMYEKSAYKNQKVARNNFFID